MRNGDKMRFERGFHGAFLESLLAVIGDSKMMSMHDMLARCQDQGTPGATDLLNLLRSQPEYADDEGALKAALKRYYGMPCNKRALYRMDYKPAQWFVQDCYAVGDCSKCGYDKVPRK